MNLKILLRSLTKKISRKIALMRSKRDFSQEFKNFSNQFINSGRNEFKLDWSDRYPILNENTSTTSFDAHYIYHTAWAARFLAKTRPTLHIDISSSLYFSAIVSAFIPFEFYDLRPAKLNLSRLETKKGNLIDLPFANNSVKSLSCMHVVEHIGLGRYGDPLDPNADLRAMDELIRVVAEGGHLLFVVPVGKPRIRFNAHRIYNPTWVLNYFENKGLHLDEFAIITDQRIFLCDQLPQNFSNQEYACGCYAFSKNQIG